MKHNYVSLITRQNKKREINIIRMRIILRNHFSKKQSRIKLIRKPQNNVRKLDNNNTIIIIKKKKIFQDCINFIQ